MRKFAQVSFETGPAPLRVQLAGFSIVASVLAIVAVWSGLHAWGLEKNGIRTTGTVVVSERSGDTSYPVFEFSDTLGRVHVVRAAAGGGDYPVGSIIPVIYPGDRPLRARIDDRVHLYAASMITGGLSGAFLIGVIVMLKFRAGVQGMFAARLGKLRVARSGRDGTVTQTEHSSSPLLTWVGRIFGAAALMMVAAAVWAGWQSYEFARTAVTTQGTVVGLARRGGSHEVQVLFSDAGRTTYRTALPERSNDYLVGDPITLVYPVGRPRDVRLRSLSVFIGLPGYFALLALVFSFVGISARIQLAEIEKARRSGAHESG